MPEFTRTSDAVYFALPLFGLDISYDQACALAAIYAADRNRLGAIPTAEELLAVADLDWLSDDTAATKLAVMRALVQYLDTIAHL